MVECLTRCWHILNAFWQQIAAAAGFSSTAACLRPLPGQPAGTSLPAATAEVGCSAPAPRAPCPGEGFGRQPVTPSTGACAHPAPVTAALQGAVAGVVWGPWWQPGFVVSLSQHHHGEPDLGRGERSRPACVPQGLCSFALALQTPRICSGLPSRVCPHPLPRSAEPCCPQRWPLSLARGAGVRWAGQAAWHEAFLTPGLCSQRHLGFPGVQPLLSWF